MTFVSLDINLQKVNLAAPSCLENRSQRHRCDVKAAPRKRTPTLIDQSRRVEVITRRELKTSPSGALRYRNIQVQVARSVLLKGSESSGSGLDIYAVPPKLVEGARDGVNAFMPGANVYPTPIAFPRFKGPR
jgi:hypothetical protein